MVELFSLCISGVACAFFVYALHRGYRHLAAKKVLKDLLHDEEELSEQISAKESKAGEAQQGSLKKEHIEASLPLIMEQLVMAVQAGHDIIAALHAVLEVEEASIQIASRPMDPVCRLFGQVIHLHESGLSFEEALREVSEQVECASLRHAFVHLALAQKEGGELVAPLRELSDATLLAHQESVDEQIAKMPVKATLPVLCLFVSLILGFLTPAIVQVIHVTGAEFATKE